MRNVVAMAMAGVLSVGVAHADVRVEEKTQLKFGGALGRMMNMFGGRATRDGVVTTVSVKGDRKATRTDQTAQIIDLAEEKIYDVDYRGKSYKVTTFAEMRRQLQEAQRKATEQAAKDGSAGKESGTPQQQVDVDFNLKESGQRRAVNGFDAREVVMTVTTREKGSTLEQSGGLVLTSNSWLAPRIAGMNELADFERRYAEKLALPTMLDAQQMAAMMAMYPMLGDAMQRFRAENVNLDGTPVLTVMTVDAVANAEQQAAQA